VLATVTRVLEKAEHPMRAREIHAAAERLAGELLRWTSVKGILAAYAEGYGARFERVRRGCYRIRKGGVQSSGQRRESVLERAETGLLCNPPHDLEPP
jgi:hypothetical protein